MSAEVETPGKKSKLENVIVESEEANPTLPTLAGFVCLITSLQMSGHTKRSVHTDRRRS